MKRLGLLLILITFNGCTPQPQEPLSLHMMQSNKLHYILNDLKNIVHEPFASPLDQDQKRIEYAAMLSTEIDALLDDLENKDLIQKYLTFTKESQRSFTSILSELKRSNNDLKSLISHYQPEKIDAAVQQNMQVCYTCHITFRRR